MYLKQLQGKLKTGQLKLKIGNSNTERETRVGSQGGKARKYLRNRGESQRKVAEFED